MKLSSIEEQAQAAFSKEDTNQVLQLLTHAKIQLSKTGLLVPTKQHSLTDLIATRGILEIGAFQAVKSGDIQGFERYIALLASFYAIPDLPVSSSQPALTGLSLLRLLSQNRIAEFHTLLQTLNPSLAQQNEITWVTNLEQSLMSGSYSRVYQLCSPQASRSQTIPHPLFTVFIPTLLSTVRSEIASCNERAYSQLAIEEARVLLFFDNANQVVDFAKTRNWIADTDSGIIVFTKEGKDGVPDGKELDMRTVIAADLAYARELESII